MAASILGIADRSLFSGLVTSVAATSRTYTTGSSLAAYVLYDNASTQTVTITDGTNNAKYTQKGSEVAIGNDRYRRFIADNITGFTGAVTATWGASSAFGSIIVVEIGSTSGWDSGNLVSQASPGTGSNGVTVSATAIGSSGIIIGFSINDSNASPPTQGTGYTDQLTWWRFDGNGGSGGAGVAARLESKTLPGSGSQSATWTAVGGTDTYANFMDIFLDAVAADTLMGQVCT